MTYIQFLTTSETLANQTSTNSTIDLSTYQFEETSFTRKTYRQFDKDLIAGNLHNFGFQDKLVALNYVIKGIFW